MQQQASLLPDHFRDAWMCIAKGVDANPADQVEITVAFEIVKITTFSAVQRQWIARIILHQVGALESNNLIESGRYLGLWSNSGCHRLHDTECSPLTAIQHVIEIDEAVAVIERKPKHDQHWKPQNAIHAHRLVLGTVV